MELSKTWLPDLTKPGMRTEDKLQAINEYLISFDKQIRHVLSNIDEENFSEGLVRTLKGTEEKLRSMEEAIGNTAQPPGGGGSYEGELPVASKTQAGIMQVGSNLKVSASGVVSVDSSTAVDSKDARPITSQAVYDEMSGMVELLKTI